MHKNCTANIAESSWADSPLQVTKIVQFMAVHYLAKRKPCSDNCNIIWSAFFKTHLKTEGMIPRYSAYLLFNPEILHLVISIITST